MPAQKQSETQVTQEPADAAGVEGGPQEPQKVKGTVHLGQPSKEQSEVAGGRTDGPILVSEPHREDDKTSYGGPGDAEPEDPPVRTTRPDVPIAVSSATGAGKHMPPDPEKYMPDGRPRL